MMVSAEAQMGELGGNVKFPTTSVILAIDRYHQELDVLVLSGFDTVRGWLCVAILVMRWSCGIK